MSFKTRRLPALIVTGDLVGVLSLRQNKLTYLKDGHLYVVRSGNDPRAWRKAVDSSGNGTGPWEHCRAQCDYFLRSGAVYDSSRQEMISQWNRTRGLDLMRENCFSSETRKEPIWKRGRRALPNTRTLNAWSEFAQESEMEGYAVSRRRRTDDFLWREQEFEQIDEFDRYRRPIAPMVTTSHLLDQHYLLRRLLRLNMVTRWAAQFPPEAMQFLENHQFSTRRWHLLNLWVRVPEGRELFDDLPQLAWMLASSWNIKKEPVQKPLRSLRSLVKKPRAKILDWLDLPGGKGTLNLLRRINPADFSQKVAYWLRETIRDDQSRSWLQNMEGRINGCTLFLLSNRQPITFPVVIAIAKNEEVNSLPVSMLYFHTRKMLRELGREDEIQNLNRVHSVNRLRAWHDQLIRETNLLPKPVNRSLTIAWDRVGNTVGPPLEPTESLRPLTTHAELAAEGREMAHCIASFSHDVAAGGYYAYAVLHEGERATLGLRRRDNKRWIFEELRGFQNSMVSDALKKYILEWIRQASNFRKPTASPTKNSLADLENEWIDDSEYTGLAISHATSGNEPF